MPELAVPLLAARMRAAGATVGVGEVLLATRALTVIDAADRTDAYFALRTALCGSRRDLAAFDAAWAQTFVATGEGGGDPGLLDDLMDAARAVLPKTAMPQTETHPMEVGEPDPLPASWSQTELELDKDFSAYTDRERVVAQLLLARLAARGPRRRSRRTRPTHRRAGRHDARATVRASLRRGGEPVDRRYRAVRDAQRPMVLVVDVSGSMSPYARMLLQYAHAAVAARRRVEVFALGTRLTRVTRELGGRDPDRALARASEQIVDLGGGTRIGAAIGELNRVHGRRLGRGAFVVILSDGWDRGEPEELAEEMARLKRTAHRLVWLNPLAADPAYEPLTRGMQAALPHTDHLLPGNSIGSLVALADLMETVH